MSIDLILNDLSIVPLAADAYEARHRMTAFVSTLRQAIVARVNARLRVPTAFHVMLLAPGYRLAEWRNDAQVDRDERLFLIRLATNAPYLENLIVAADNALRYEFEVDAQKAEGCGVAYLLDGLSISFQSHSRWNVSHISVTVRSLDDAGNIEEEVAEIVHASHPEHVLEHQGWIQKRLTESVGTGAEMWERRSQFFPSLIFCDRVEKQVRELEYGTSMLQPVAKVLFDLEAACRMWTQGAFDVMLIPAKVSPESPATLHQFASERTFRCPDGVERVFDWHVKININAWRVHFYFDNAKPSSLIIGYIGKHLPTASDRT